MVRLKKILTVLILSATVGGIDQGDAEERGTCTAIFSPTESIWRGESLGKWLRSESRVSVQREDGATIWIFGNSLVNFPGHLDEDTATAVPNVVGISRCNSSNGEFEMQYHWEISKRFEYESVFRPRDLPPRFSYSPGQPWMYHGFLFVPLLVVERVVGDVGYRIVGTHLARVWNPDAHPSEWKISYGALFEIPEMKGGKGVVQRGSYTYLFNGTEHGTVLSRIRSSDLMGSMSSLLDRVEYFNKDGSWNQIYSVARIKAVALDPLAAEDQNIQNMIAAHPLALSLTDY